jgi:hypothetical protein
MRSIELKVKIKNLANEARTMRAEEVKAKAKRDTSTLNILHHHRTYTVRRAARHSQLAYGYLRGVQYSRMEKPGSQGLFGASGEIAKMVRKYGSDDFENVDRKDIWAWIEDAEADVPKKVASAGR